MFERKILAADNEALEALYKEYSTKPQGDATDAASLAARRNGRLIPPSREMKARIKEEYYRQRSALQ